MASKDPLLDGPLKAPFPWFGGKSRAAELIWARLGETPNYIEPFAGSLAVMLRRPWAPPKYETVNDLDVFIPNFWRSVQPPDAEPPDAEPPAVQGNPELVAHYADWPVFEADLTARHRYICEVRRKGEFKEAMLTDPHFYDPLIAGWWVWGLSCWIGAGWCQGTWHGPDDERNTGRGMHHSVQSEGVRPDLASTGRGVTSATPEFMATSQRGVVGENGRPLKSAGGKWSSQINVPQGYCMGVHQLGARDATESHEPPRKRPHLHNAQGVGLGRPRLQRPYQLNAPPEQLPRLGGPGGQTGVHQLGARRNEALIKWFNRLAERLRHVRVCCGDWRRITGKAVLTSATPCAVLLDPPYSAEAGRSSKIYNSEDLAVAHQCRKWCLEHGDDPQLRIALCGYEGEGHEELEAKGWEVAAWKASGGYGRIHGETEGKSLENRHRERVWFSPHCLKPNAPVQGQLFEEACDG